MSSRERKGVGGMEEYRRDSEKESRGKDWGGRGGKAARYIRNAGGKNIWAAEKISDDTKQHMKQEEKVQKQICSNLSLSPEVQRIAGVKLG